MLACGGDEDRASCGARGAVCSVGVDGSVGGRGVGFSCCRGPFGDEVCQDLGFYGGAGYKPYDEGG